MTSKRVSTFRREVWKYWKENGRHNLEWRKTHDPYKILVSEIMLQQTQVPRVIPKYKEFLKEFPNVRVLAKAPLSDVLRVWSGLGYNRRAKFLHDAAREIVEKYNSHFPREYEKLRALPGVGDYTAKAVRAFAWNEPEILIETNIRTVFMHHFYSSVLQKTAIRNERRMTISDEEMVTYIELAAEGQDPREWNWALMDYGAHLKAAGVRVNALSKHYVKQSKFEGSLRQVRGAILKALTKKEPLSEVQRNHSEQFNEAFMSLVREGLVEK